MTISMSQAQTMRQLEKEGESIAGISRKVARLFGAILADCGIEFCDFEAIERRCLSNARRCRIYYCDPQRSGQKGRRGDPEAESAPG